MPLFGRPTPRDERLLIVFARAPASGTAKQSAQTKPGDDLALRLRNAMFLDTLALARAAGTPVLLSLAGDSHDFDLPADWRVVRQPNSSLGDRLAWSFAQAFARGAQQMVLIGARLPHLPVSLLHEAFTALKREQAVIGPAHDGGYYLLGLNDQMPWLFNGITWGAADIFSQTLALLEAHHRRTALLPEQHAMRTREDAIAVAPLLRDQPALAVLTARVLSERLAAG